MKITKSQLRQIIKEELKNGIDEGLWDTAKREFAGAKEGWAEAKRFAKLRSLAREYPELEPLLEDDVTNAMFDKLLKLIGEDGIRSIIGEKGVAALINTINAIADSVDQGVHHPGRTWKS
jgi:hypothetical protein